MGMGLQTMRAWLGLKDPPQRWLTHVSVSPLPPSRSLCSMAKALEHPHGMAAGSLSPVSVRGAEQEHCSLGGHPHLCPPSVFRKKGGPRSGPHSREGK